MYTFQPLLGPLPRPSVWHKALKPLPRKAPARSAHSASPCFFFEWVKRCRRWVISGPWATNCYTEDVFIPPESGKSENTYKNMPQAPMLAVFSSHVNPQSTLEPNFHMRPLNTSKANTGWIVRFLILDTPWHTQEKSEKRGYLEKKCLNYI